MKQDGLAVLHSLMLIDGFSRRFRLHKDGKTWQQRAVGRRVREG
ncbi:MAG: hypothetical protein ACKESB_01995 [Candidatus Hodgkinia cicadicola]